MNKKNVWASSLKLNSWSKKPEIMTSTTIALQKQICLTCRYDYSTDYQVMAKTL